MLHAGRELALLVAVDAQVAQIGRIRQIVDDQLAEGLVLIFSDDDADPAVGHLTGAAAAAQLLFYIAATIKCRNGIKWS